MSNPRIEEVSDSDPEIDDPSEFLPNEIMRPANAPTPSSQPTPSQPNPTLVRPPPPTQQQPNLTESEVNARRAEIKPFMTLYPLYFSSTRTRATGRRVSKSLATINPLAFTIYKAARSVLGPSIRVNLEADKTHPKDWSNPGRVKIQLFDTTTHTPLHPSIKNKQHLYNLIAKKLQEWGPTSPEDPLELKIQGLPVPENFLEQKIAVPRGWRMNEILPVHSSAVSGGGVSDNFLKEAMEEMKAMQGAGGAGGQGPGGMDMGAMAQMMQSMGGMSGFGGGGGGAVGGAGGSGGGKKKDKKKD